MREAFEQLISQSIKAGSIEFNLPEEMLLQIMERDKGNIENNDNLLR